MQASTLHGIGGACGDVAHLGVLGVEQCLPMGDAEQYSGITASDCLKMIEGILHGAFGPKTHIHSHFPP